MKIFIIPSVIQTRIARSQIFFIAFLILSYLVSSNNIRNSSLSLSLITDDIPTDRSLSSSSYSSSLPLSNREIILSRNNITSFLSLFNETNNKYNVIIILSEIWDTNQEIRKHKETEKERVITPIFLSALSLISSLSSGGWSFSLDREKRGVLSVYAVRRERREEANQRECVLNSRIPYLLHQTWKSRDVSTHSTDALECSHTLQTFASDFLHIVWTDEDIKKLVLQRYPQHYRFYINLNMNIKRADMGRYFVLLAFGGLYLDLDVELKRPAAQLLSSSLQDSTHNRMTSTISSESKRESSTFQFVSYITKEYEEKNDHFAGNAVFAAAPQSPIIRAMIAHIRHFKQQRLTGVFGVLRHTGPMGLGDVLHSYRIKMNLTVSQSFSNLKYDTMYEREMSPKTYRRHCSLHIRVHNSSVVGNVEDHPTHAEHRRRHRWRKSGQQT